MGHLYKITIVYFKYILHKNLISPIFVITNVTMILNMLSNESLIYPTHYIEIDNNKMEPALSTGDVVVLSEIDMMRWNLSFLLAML